jgi:hypothetical protein
MTWPEICLKSVWYGGMRQTGKTPQTLSGRMIPALLGLFFARLYLHACIGMARFIVHAVGNVWI